MFRRTNFCPSKPTLTEENLPDQTGKVFIVTGGASGIGKELVKILYQHNAKVYIAGRSLENAETAMKEIRASHPSSKGQMIFLKLVLDDLTTIKSSADEFLSKESHLDVLWNNAGVMHPKEGSKTVQGYELQQGTNSIGHFAFAHFLTPLLLESAKKAPKGTVRIIWVSSISCDFAPKPAIDFSNMNYAKDEAMDVKYNRSKVGNLLHAIEFSKRYPDSGVLSLSLNPGLLRTNLQRNFKAGQNLMMKIVGNEPRFGAYTELFAGLDPSVTAQDKYVTPFGSREEPREDLKDAEMSRKYWDWSEEQIRPYL